MNIYRDDCRIIINIVLNFDYLLFTAHVPTLRSRKREDVDDNKSWEKIETLNQKVRIFRLRQIILILKYNR